jgi:hypothetical protein
VLLKSPVSPGKWPVANAAALAVVKVGNIECEFLKLTPRSRIAAIVGALCGVTFMARNPSGTNSTTLCGVLSWAAATPTVTRPAVNSASFFRSGDMKKSPLRA